MAAELETLGTRVLPIQLDASDAGEVGAMVRTTLKTFGVIHGLINCAGIFDATPIADLTVEQWDRMLAVNLRSVFVCSQAVLPTMKEWNHGRIVSISSLAAQVGGVFAGAHYSAAKAGILSFTRSLARQVAGCGINVNAICPGPTLTPMADQWPPGASAQTLANVPLGRFGQPEDIANVALFLASEVAGYIHGAHVDVNGGLYMD